ncbi:MAG: hypothetical protein QN168_01555 [Armatimonadota bacterium]|nr:hypothetical protein [Armatimonadota bacterium]
MGRTPCRRQHAGFTTLEVLIASLLIVMVVVFTGRVIVGTLRLIGRGNSDEQQGARLRTQATVWVQAVTEHTRKLGFAQLDAACPTVPCDFRVPASPGPYAQAPALPGDFSCGRILLRDWDAAGSGADPSAVRLLTVELYRVACSDLDGAAPFTVAHTGVATR